MAAFYYAFFTMMDCVLFELCTKINPFPLKLFLGAFYHNRETVSKALVCLES